MPRIDRPERIQVISGVIPRRYHCRCRFCRRAIGELRRVDGDYYNRNERRRYYDPVERGKSGHVAKTPLHIARWAVQQFTSPGDWVLDPTAGAGTTLVEALREGRNVAGVELQFGGILRANVRRSQRRGLRAEIQIGDAREARGFLEGLPLFTLIVNNPPYSGDEHMSTLIGSERWTFSAYDRDLPNLALLKEGDEYWSTIRQIYQDCTDFLRPGGVFVVGVKDQMRQKRPDQLHERFAEVLESIGLEHEGTAFLKHYPGTLHLNTYFKRYGVHPPYYQTILVFRRGG